jgi:hypothetical protein
MWTTGASGPEAWTLVTIVPSGAESIRYQTVASTRPHFDTCGSSRSPVASTVVPCATAGNVGKSCAAALLSFGGGVARAGAGIVSAGNAKSVARSATRPATTPCRNLTMTPSYLCSSALRHIGRKIKRPFHAIDSAALAAGRDRVLAKSSLTVQHPLMFAGFATSSCCANGSWPDSCSCRSPSVWRLVHELRARVRIDSSRAFDEARDHSQAGSR